MSAADRIAEAREALATLIRLIPTMDPYEGEGSCPPCRYCYEHDWRPHRATCSWAREEAAKTRAESTLTAAIADVERLTRERDDARDETKRLWDATEADRARMAVLESRPTYEDGVKAAAGVACCVPSYSIESGRYACGRARDILALLEPKP